VKAAPVPRPARLPYRMKDLTERTGLPRQVIHFYIQQGLVPEGEKTGRNMAFYGEVHVARIKLVQKLQHERFLPLRAIRAVLGETKDPFTAEQRSMLLEVKDSLGEAVAPPAAGYVDAKGVLARSGVGEKELRQMIVLGVVAGIEERGRGGKKARLRIAADDAWIVESWGEVRRAGFSAELGFSPKDLAVIEEKLGELFDWETTTLAERLQTLDPAQVGVMIQRALPLINTFLVRAHERKVRTFFAQLGGLS
jgi:DNA-binding transcriptional MerR regulator